MADEDKHQLIRSLKREFDAKQAQLRNVSVVSIMLFSCTVQVAGPLRHCSLPRHRRCRRHPNPFRLPPTLCRWRHRGVRWSRSCVEQHTLQRNWMSCQRMWGPTVQWARRECSSMPPLVTGGSVRWGSCAVNSVGDAGELIVCSRRVACPFANMRLPLRHILPPNASPPCHDHLGRMRLPCFMSTSPRPLAAAALSTVWRSTHRPQQLCIAGGSPASSLGLVALLAPPPGCRYFLQPKAAIMEHLEEAVKGSDGELKKLSASREAVAKSADGLRGELNELIASLRRR